MPNLKSILPYLKGLNAKTPGLAKDLANAGIGSGVGYLENKFLYDPLAKQIQGDDTATSSAVGSHISPLLGALTGFAARRNPGMIRDSYVPKLLALSGTEAGVQGVKGFMQDAPLRKQTAELNRAAAADNRTTEAIKLEQAKGWTTQDKIMAALAAAGIGAAGLYGFNSLRGKRKGGAATKEVLKGDPSQRRKQKLRIDVPADSLPPEFFQSLIDADGRDRALTTLQTKAARFEFEVDRDEMLAGLAADLAGLYKEAFAYGGDTREDNISRARSLPANDPNSLNNVVQRFNRANGTTQRMDADGNIRQVQRGVTARPGEQVTTGANGIRTVDGNPALTAARERAAALPPAAQATALAYDSRLKPFNSVAVGPSGTTTTQMSAVGQPVQPAAPAVRPSAAPAAPTPSAAPVARPSPAAAVGSQVPSFQSAPRLSGNTASLGNPQRPAAPGGTTVTLPSGKQVDGVGPGGNLATSPAPIRPAAAPAASVGAQMNAQKAPSAPSPLPTASVGSRLPGTSTPSAPSFSPSSAPRNPMPNQQFSSKFHGGAGGKRR